MANHYPEGFSYHDGRAYIGNIALDDVIASQGTPLYVLDAKTITKNCKQFLDPLTQLYSNSRVLYACKANLTVGLAQYLYRLGMSFDVSSGGELYTLIKAGVDSQSIYFHGNNKTLPELELALDYNVTVIVDNFQELKHIIQVNKTQKSVRVMLRIKPEIDAHTHDYIKTGKLDSKFGIERNDFKNFFTLISEYSWFDFVGIHGHIGSQIFDTKPYFEFLDTMMPFLKQLHDEFGVTVKEFNCGGGMGIFYTKEDTPFNIESFLREFTQYFIQKCDELFLTRPVLLFEPGRSIIGPAGITLYTVGAVKHIPNVKSYIFVDGGMADNIRPLLYDSKYVFDHVNKKKDATKDVYSIAGKFCESGDILAENIELSEVVAGDQLIVFSTGAYNYSMASNYNRNARPAMVLISNDKIVPLLKRETYEDLIRLDCEIEGK